MEKTLVFSATKKDFEITWYSGTGPGGQHRNKHQNCCRIKHIASGLMTTCTEYRERTANLKCAFRKLANLLVDHYIKKEEPEVQPQEVVRTYHAVRNIVKDHLTGLTKSYKDTVDSMDLEEFIETRARVKAGIA
jgi:protein subunit release factor B